MPNRHRILIVDDDPEMRDALTERLSLHEEFEAREQIDGRRLAFFERHAVPIFVAHGFQHGCVLSVRC
jgi:DNA-binding response OmpR family regulator